MTSKAKKKSDIHKLQRRVLALEEANEAKAQDWVDVWEAIEADGRQMEKQHYLLYRNVKDLRQIERHQHKIHGNTIELRQQQDVIEALAVEVYQLKTKLASIDVSSAKPLNFDLSEDDEWLNLDIGIDLDRRPGCDCPWCSNGVGQERIHD